MGRRDARGLCTGRRSHRRVPRRLGAVVGGLVVLAGTTTVFDASSFVLGNTPPAASSCSDSWTGGGPAGDWDSAANWTTGVPNGAGVDACITGNANVTLSAASYSVGALTVSAGSSLTIGAPTIAGPTPTNGAPVTTDPIDTDSIDTEPTVPSLTILTGLQNDGAVTVAVTGSSGHSGLALDGSITNTGTLTVDGTLGVGGSSTNVRNDGTIGVAPGGLVDMDATSTVTNEPDGLLAFGINGPPSATSAYGRITNGTLVLGGTVDPVFENGSTAPTGAEYFVRTGPSPGTFATVLHGATADYSHADEVGLIGGASATATVTGVTSSIPTDLLVGERVQLTAVVTPASATGATGSVSFSVGGAPLGSAALTAGATGSTTATLGVSSLPVGADSVTATYGGDVLFGASTSPALTQVVNPDPTTLTITPSLASPEAGQPVTDTATVMPAPTSSGTPTGSVSFTDDGNPIAGCQSLPLPDAAPLDVQCSETFGSGATHLIVAAYSGDPDDAGSTASLQQTAGQTPTQTTITTQTPSIVYGQDAVVVATVAPAGGAAVSPSGTVTFSDGSAPLATMNVSSSGGVATASLDTSSLDEGAHFVTATYSGDPTYATSTTTAPLTINVAEAPTTVTVASASAQSVVGQTVVFTASITSSAPGATGTVQFDDNGNLIGSGPVSGGQATFQSSSLALGTHPITAIYEGDDNFIGVSSTNTVMQNVVPAATSTEVASAANPGLVGETIAYSATVAVSTPGSGAPTGTVSFNNAGIPIPTCQGIVLPADAPPAVTCTQVYDSTATENITASYSGDANFTASAGAVAERVSPVSTTTALVSSPSASTSGQSVTLTATVSPTSGSASPDGTVSFTLNGVPLGDSVLSTANGVSSASMLLTTLPIGSDAVSASYEGDTAFLASAATGAALVTVTRAPTTLGLLGSADLSNGGQPMTLTATVFPATGSGESGTVTFFDNGARIGADAVSNGQATLTVVTGPTGDDAFTADYSGDADFIASSTTMPLLPSQ